MRLKKVGEADDGGEDVIEVVGNAARELADGFHLGALRVLEFERLLLGRIDHVDDRCRLAVARDWVEEQATGVGTVLAERDLHGFVTGAALQCLIDGTL